MSYFPDLENGVDDADVDQIIAAFNRVEEDVKNARGSVTSVAGKTGEVTLDKTDVGLNNVDNTSDMDKPISTQMSGALNEKANRSELNYIYSVIEAKLAEKAKGFRIRYITTSAVSLDDHYDLRGTQDPVYTMELSTPSTIPSTYECYLSFRSGGNPTTLTYSATPIKWVGVDCDSDGDFVPSPNKVYEIGIRNVGDDSSGNPMVIARVGVC